MIQAVTTRMAGNSFLIKRWSITLVAALFVLAARHIFQPSCFGRSIRTSCAKNVYSESYTTTSARLKIDRSIFR